MGQILYKPKIEYRLYKDLNNLVFEDYYSSIFCYSFNKTSSKELKYTENRVKKCAFCGKDMKETTFKDDAHVLPAFFNDSKLLSLEECDQCNHKFSEFESDLSKMLGPYLISGGIGPRRGITRKSPKNKPTTIELNVEDGLFVKTNEKIDIDKENGIITIPFYNEKYNLQKAIRALLHTFWLVINEINRSELSWILESLNNLNFNIPTEYYFGFAETNANTIDLDVFKKIKEDDRICDYILKIKFGNYFIYYGINNKPIFKPILIENILINTSLNSSPSLSLRRFDKENIKSQTIPITFNFENFNLSSIGKTKKIKKVKELIVSLSINNETIINKTYLKQYKDGKFILGDLDLCLNITSFKNKVILQWKLNNQNILNLKNTLSFIDSINCYKKVEVSQLSDNNLLGTISINAISVNNNFKNFIDNLYTIATELNHDIFFKYPFKNSDMINAVRLVSIMHDKKKYNNIIKISSDDLKSLNNYYYEIENEKELNIVYPREFIKIFNKTYDLSKLFTLHCTGIKAIKMEENNIFINTSEINTEEIK